MAFKKKFLIFIFFIIGIFLITSLYLFGKRNHFQGYQKTTAQIGKKDYLLYIADTQEKKVKGLSNISSLPKNQGMIFLFEKRGYHQFWMKGMRFPLDFIFLNDNKVIDIKVNVSPLPETNKISPIEGSNTVIELNAYESVFAQLKVGDRVNFKKNLARSQYLSKKDYKVVTDELLKIVDSQNPKSALIILRDRIKKDQVLLRSCHPLVHEIGHRAFEKYKDFGEALRYQDEICNSGFLHGVIESFFEKNHDPLKPMQTLCNKYPLGKFLSWQCFHGVGHGLMYYSSNNLPDSLKDCESYKKSFASEACINGVFMENFSTDQKIHPSKFLNENEPLYPCSEQKENQKAVCYFYAPTYYLALAGSDYIEALKLCSTAEKSHQAICAAGVGSQAMKENINNPIMVEEICQAGESWQRNPCISGMVSLYIFHHGDLKPAKELCQKLESKNRQICYNSIKSRSHLFN